jgi:pimeloyl-ACP methyl ester carboxylesterase
MASTTAHVRESGSGETVVCIHSSASSSGQWRALMESLSDRYRVLAPDLYGYGKSPAWPGDRELQLEDEIGLFSNALPPMQRVHLIGHSYGGLIALRYALANPARIASLIVYEPVGFFLLEGRRGFENARREIETIREETSRLVDAGDAEGSAQRFVDYWVGPAAWSQTPDTARMALANGMRKVRFEWARGFDGSFPSRDLSTLPMPTLMLTGSGSTAAARGVVRVLRELLPGHAEVVELDGLGHMGPITHPEAVNTAVAAFLDRIRSADAGPDQS